MIFTKIILKQKKILIMNLKIQHIALGILFILFFNSSAKDVEKNAIVRVHPFLQQKNDPDISWFSIITERKIIEFLAGFGVTVLSPMIRFETSAEPYYHIKGSVNKKDSLLTAAITLIDKRGNETASGKLTGTIEFFRKIRNVIGETAIYALGMDPHNLLKNGIKKRPACSNRAFALYLLAKRKLLAEKQDSAIRFLFEVVEDDPQFATAFWTISQIYMEKGIKDSSVLWDRKAKMIDKDHLSLQYRDSINREQPLKDLLELSGKQDFITIDNGISYKHILLKKYQLSSVIWIVDPKFFKIDIQIQEKCTGNYIEEFVNDSNTILALNGGFFEMDGKHCISPSGLIVRNSKVNTPVTAKGGSGVFCAKNGIPEIIWSKEIANAAEYEIAFQSGPVIVENGGKLGVYSNDYRRLNRSAVGISDNKIILTVLAGEKGDGLSLYEFARFLQISRDKGGAGCDAALNLDGGASTQVCFNFKDIKINIEGLWAINSAIVIKKK